MLNKPPHQISMGQAFDGSSDYDFDDFADDEIEQQSEEYAFDAADADPLDLRWAWAEVDSKAISHNVREFKKRIGARPMLLATVKADAYGHGAVEVAKIALAAGATWLAVATVMEGVELRRAGLEAPILLLAEPPATAVNALLAYDITPAVYTLDFALAYGEQAAMRGVSAKYHLAVNTGMNRIGVWFSEVGEFVRLTSFHKALEMQGMFTHFATADSDDGYAFQLQLKRFKQAVTLVHDAGAKPRIVHCANSAAGIRYRDSYFDMVRMGIAMYGLNPSPVTRGMMELWPAMSVHARVIAVSEPPVGEGVGYGLTYRSNGGVKIATVPIGYADGLSRQLSNKMNVLFKGRLMPQVGNICMDQFMFEIDTRSTLRTQAPEIEIGDEVIIIGRDGEQVLHLDAMAAQLGTINYELACRFGMRLNRVYV